MQVPRRRKRQFSRRADRRSQRGAATVECALIAPVLLLILLGAMDVGQYISLGQAVSNASLKGARLAARHSTLNVSDVESSVSSYLADNFANLPDSTLNAAIQVNVTDASGTAIAAGDLQTVNTGSPLTVEVVLQYDSVRWLKAISLLNNRTLSTTTVVRRE